MIRSIQLRRPDFSDRGTQLALITAAAGVVVLAVAVAAGAGNFGLLAGMIGLLVAPAALLVMLKRPYLFPYGLYVVLIPFDNMLKLGSAGTLTRLLGLLSLAAISAHVLIVRRIGHVPRSAWLWLFFLAWSGTAIAWSPDLPNAFLQIQTTGSLVLMYMLFSVAPIDERDLRAIFACAILGGVAASAYGMYLLHDAPVAMAGDYGRLMIDVGDRRIDTNHFANSLLGPIALAFVGLLSARKPGTLLLFAATVAVLGGGILISLSREAMVACVLIVAVVIAMSRRRVLGLLVAGPALVLVPLFVPTIGQRMMESAATGGAGRTSLWHVAWYAIQQHPLFGWGLSGATDAYDRNALSVYQHYFVGWTITPHNSILRLALDLGIVGVSLYVLAYAAAVVELRSIRRGDPLYDMRTAVTAALAGLACVAMFIDLETYKYVWLMLVTATQLRHVAVSRSAALAPAQLVEPRVVPRVAHPARATP